MKRQTIAIFFLVFCCFVQLVAQDTSTKREVSAAEEHKVREGKNEDFKYQLDRFESAFEEKDLNSTRALKKMLIKKMTERITLLENENSKDKDLQSQLKKQKEILDEFKKYQFSMEVNKSKEGFMQLEKLKAFSVLMESNFETY